MKSILRAIGHNFRMINQYRYTAKIMPKNKMNGKKCRNSH